MTFDVLGIIAPHPPILVPEVGHGDSEVARASATALGHAADLLGRFAPQTVVIMSPHTEAYSDAFTVTTAARVRGDLGRFGAPEVVHDVPGDPELAEAIIAEAMHAGISVAPHEDIDPKGPLDHGVLVPMRFLDPGCHFPLVDLSFTYLSPEVHVAFGASVRRAAERIGRRIAFVASGDMSHRLKPDAPAGYSPRAADFDAEVVRLVGRGDFDALASIDPILREEAGECGWRSFLTLGGFLRGDQVASKVLSYEGPWGVGYMVAVFAPEQELSGLPVVTPTQGSKGGSKGDAESEPVALARATIEEYVTNHTRPSGARLTDSTLPERAGAFVSLHEHGRLRGCIGTIAPTRPSLAEEIAHNAVAAATEDPRFPPLSAEELDGLEIKVDVLHAPEHASSLGDLDPKTYGVITTCGSRRGLLLPDLEGVDTCEDQVAIAMQKGGIAAGEPIHLERFKVDRYV
jgi:AmmeMemoRadiSam system protein A